MITKRIGEAGVTSDMAYTAAAASILLSIGIWSAYKNEEPGHAERFGIFVGLWAPTLAILGVALEMEEKSVEGRVSSAKRSVERVEKAVGKAFTD